MEIKNCSECFFKEVGWDENPCLKCGGWKDGSKANMIENKEDCSIIIDELKNEECKNDNVEKSKRGNFWENKRKEEAKKFGKKLKFEREKKNLSKVLLARAVGISAESIKKYENGNNFPTPKVFKRIIDFLNVDASKLIELPKIRTIGDNIKYYRLKNGLNSDELREMSKTKNMSDYELNKYIPEERALIRIADVLKVTVNDLMDGVH